MRISRAIFGALAACGVASAVEFTCGSTDPPLSLLEVAADMQDNDDALLDSRAPLVIDTYVHVVTTLFKTGKYTSKQIDQEIAYMNKAYGPAGISFRRKSLDFTTNNVWATGATKTAMKRSLRKGTYRDLNLYFLSDLSLGTGLLGICPFPTKFSGQSDPNFINDGCVIYAESLPHGDLQGFNLGGTAAHETGHWFGLLHVFQGNSCKGRGDHISDTPTMLNATSGCPTGKDTCPDRPGADPIHNYMDYSSDACYNNFTPLQRKRMKSMFNTFRAGK